MSQALKSILVCICALLVTGCAMFMVINLNALSKGNPPPDKADPGEDLLGRNREMAEKLRQAPWQGLRYLREERTWRFYALTGETRTIDLIQPMSLIKVFYMGEGGEINFTWVTTEIRFRGKAVFPLAPEVLEGGQLVAVQLQGDYVNPSGVYWQDCDLEYCRIAQMIDTMLYMDDKGTGISNGFIRNGWAPPTDPLFGFLCWQIKALEETHVDILGAGRG